MDKFISGFCSKVNMKVAEIYVGRLSQVDWEAEPVYENCASLYVEGELISSEKCLRKGPRTFLNEIAEDFSRLISELEATHYKITNGKRTSSSTGELVDCEEMHIAPGIEKIIARHLDVNLKPAA